jgi:hypothetical protein
VALPWVKIGTFIRARNPAYACEQRHQLSRHRRLNSRPSRTTIYATAGTLAAASVAAIVIVCAPALVSALNAANQALGASGGKPVGVGWLRNARHREHAVRSAPHLARGSSDTLVRLSARGDMQALSGVAQPAGSALRVAHRAPAAFPRASPRRAPVRGTALSGTPQQIAMAMLPSFGWPPSEFSCVNALWQRESGWNPCAANPSSGAYGIPQALPASKMASAGADWQTSAATQIRWGLGYIRATYGSPCGAWQHESSYGWY